MDRNMVFEAVTKEYGLFVHRILSEREAMDLIPQALDTLELVEFGEPCFSTEQDICNKSGINWFIDTFQFDAVRDTPIAFNKTVGGKSLAVYGDEYGICGINPSNPNNNNNGGSINGDWNRTIYDEPPNYSKRITEYEIHDDWYQVTLSSSSNAGTTEPYYDLHITNNDGNPRKIRDIRVSVRAFGIETNGIIEDLSPYDPYVALNTKEADLQNGTGVAIGHSLLSDTCPFVYNAMNKSINEPDGTANWNFTQDRREFHAERYILLTRRGLS